MKTFYLTTTLPYVNAAPHIGFALEIIQGDAVVRYQRMLGKDVFFNTGTDEHGLKIYQNAIEAGIDPQVYCDQFAAKFRDLETLLNLDQPKFIRTTDEYHVKAAQEFWDRSFTNGDIYKKNYQVKYCVGCELEKTDSELEDDKCPIHPSREVELIDEENYFFRFSKYQQPLLEYYEKNKKFVAPDYRFNEIKEFVKKGLQDFSISRLKEKMPWGVPVPNDPEHVMYVWFDALINYVSTLDWPVSAPAGATPGKPELSNFEKYWGTKDEPNAIQVAGKDNLRQQTAMWQAMLMSAGLPNSKQVFIHGFITSEGKKMSKSEGNVVDPYEVVGKYGIDAVRHYLLGGISPDDDGDFSISRFEEFYTAHLVNGIGNLTCRVLTMIEKYSDGKIPAPVEIAFGIDKFWQKYNIAMNEFRFDDVVRLACGLVSECDEQISSQKPWEKVKTGEDISLFLYQLAETLRHIALALLPIIPESAEKILEQLGASEIRDLEWGKLQKDGIIKKGELLFPRLG